MARRKNNSNQEPSPFAQDLTGIFLIAIAVFIFISSVSSATGFIGLYFVKLALRSFIGVGIYVLPFFLAAYGMILLFRREVSELRTRFAGFLLMFLAFISAVQFYSPLYFKNESQYKLVQGAGGILGYSIKFVLERTIGFIGACIVLFSIALISLLLIFNITMLDVLRFFGKFFSFMPIIKKQDDKKIKAITQAQNDKAIQVQMPLLKQMPTQEDASFQINEENLEHAEKELPKVIEFKHEEMKDDVDLVLEEPKSGEAQGKKEKRSYNSYKLPPLNLLEDPSPKEKQKQDRLRETTEFRKKLLEETLKNFGVGARVVSINQGPAVTRFELQPDPGVKISRIASLSDDIALNLAAQGVRIEAPVPGKSVIGIEVPNTTVTAVRLKEIVKTNEFQNNPSKLFIGLGKDLSGAPIFGDLAKMPHLLIAGTTGSGKSVCVNSIITSLLLRSRPDEVKFIMIDPKMVELSVYDDIPHLLAPVVTNPRKAALTLREWVMREMEHRYHLFYDAGARNLAAYNAKVEEKLPSIVVLIDELADLMMVAAAEVETTICRLAQMARATGIHLVIATQRPSVDVITGLIKANIPSRIAFAVATQIDSRVILDASGAEKLLGRGDMLYSPVGAMKPIRLQGSYVSDKETERIIKFVKEQAEPEYLEEITNLQLSDEEGTSLNGNQSSPGRDALFVEAVKLVIESQIASTSYLQRKMRIGYNRAARLMDEIETAGVVSRPEGENKSRRITATMEILAQLGIK